MNIGIHSACNNLRVVGSSIHSSDITGILVDGGAAIDILGNLIEGNAGPAIILSAGDFGAPMGVTITSNYYEANNLDAIHMTDADGNAVRLCTDLLLNGKPWNKSITDDYPLGCNEHCPPIGALGSGFPTIGVTYTGNTHDPPSTAAAPHCTAYAAITAAAVVGLTASGNMLTSVLPGMPALHGTLLQTGTDDQNWFAADISLIGNPNVPPFEPAHENYGFDRPFILLNATRSLLASPPTRYGELPLHTFFSDSEAQRNFYVRGQRWVPLNGSAVLNVTVNPNGYDLLETTRWTATPPQAATGTSALVATLDLESTPSIAGRPVYFAMQWRPEDGTVSETTLTLLIDPGSGVWQRSEVGMRCNPQLVRGCTDAGPVLTPAGWTQRVFAAELLTNGTARFALKMAGRAGKRLAADISGLVIAPIGAPLKAVVS